MKQLFYSPIAIIWIGIFFKPVQLLFNDTKTQGISNCVKPGVLALTFDDGPSTNGGTKNVLKVLKEEGVKATFFVTGRGYDTTFLDSDHEKHNLLRQIFSEGHQIGSHTWSHSNNLLSMTKQQVYDDISHLADTVYNILGINMTVLRAPYGNATETFSEFIKAEFGYQLIGWNLNTYDWKFANIEASFKIYQNRLDQDDNFNLSRSFIALHHDPQEKSGELAKRVIQFVRSKGFRMVTISECIGIFNQHE